MTSDRLSKLQALLRARSGIAGYEKNCEAIREEIARLERAANLEFDDNSAVAPVTEQASAVASKD